MQWFSRGRLGIALIISTMLAGAGTAADEVSAQRTMVSTYVAAYNTRNLETMRSMMHRDVQWIMVDSGQSELVADGRDVLTEQMRSYFASGTESYSTFSVVIENGRFLTTRETAHWKTPDGGEKAQSSIVVYEFEDGLVRRVWYYPSQ